MAKKLYDENSIESLSPLEFTRLRPGVYAGDTTYSTQLLVEILSNAIDEFRLGNGTTITIKIDDNNVITVTDEGQGFIPNSYRDDGKSILEAAFSVINTSGKYRNDGTYEGTSLGSFGIGSKLTNFLSHWLDVTTYRDCKTEKIHFVEGEFKKRTTGVCGKTIHGTTVSWQPSEEFFTYPEIEEEKIIPLLKTTVCLCPGLLIKYNNKGKEREFNSKNGLTDLVDENVKGKEIISKRFVSKFTNGKNVMDFILTYTSSYASSITAYVNTGLTERGPHITVLKALLTRELNNFFLDKKWLKDKKDSFSGDDIQEGIYIVFNLTAQSVAYNAQVKTDITKIDMTPFTSILAQEFQMWLAVNEKEIKKIFDKALKARAAREAAKKARDKVREPKDKKKQFLNLPSKLVDCWSKNREKCELFIVEGDSAAGGLIEGRDAEYVAIFPVRGKIISSYKNTPEKIFANQEVVNLIKAIGLELDSKTNKLIYDDKKLRYGKILLAADADPDGSSIRNLLIEMFWWLCPELIENGHLYTTMPPLFRITTNKNKYVFVKDAKALEEYKIQHQGEKYLINRNKGLGEQDAEELAEALLDPNTRNIEQLVIIDKKSTEDLIEMLLGPSVPPRREFLLAHSEEANSND